MQKKLDKYWVSILLLSILMVMCSCQSRITQTSDFQNQKTQEITQKAEEVKPMPTRSPENAPVTSNTKPSATGSIAGKLSYPSEGIPPLRLIFFNIDTDSWYSKDFPANTVNFQMDGLVPGKYKVVAYLVDN